MRLCTYNVHMWTTENMKPNRAKCAEVLRQISPDLCGLQEVVSFFPEDGDITPEIKILCKELVTSLAVIGLDDQNSFGITNAIISPLKVLNTAWCELSGYRIVVMTTVLIEPGEGLPSFPFTFFCIHLDHRIENKRVNQLEEAFEFIKGKNVGPHAIVGDFNSLRPEDYTEETLKQVVDHRAKHRWEGVRNQVISKMDAFGYVDAYRLNLLYQKNPDNFSFSRSAYEASLKEKAYRFPRKTINSCWAGTRIDFIWLSGDLMDKIDFKGYQRIESQASDHFPLVCDFDWKKPANPSP